MDFLTTLVQDLRYGLRMLGRNPGFAAVAVPCPGHRGEHGDIAVDLHVLGFRLLVALLTGFGWIGAFTLTRLMKSLLFGVSATDPLTISMVGALLITVSLLACYVPARRPSKVDPMVALRCE